MFSKQRFICLLLAMLLLLSLAACGKGNDTPSNNGQTSGQEQTTGNAGSQYENNESTGNETPGSQTVESFKLTGAINLVHLDDRDPSVLRGVIIKGNQVGTAEFNSRESSLTDVRCIFNLDEWVEFYPDTDKEYALRVWVLKHRDDQEYYNTYKFSDLMPNFASYCDLHYPADEDNPDEYPWGSFYLHSEECEPGYYDFVFTYEGKAIATLLTRFYKEGELSAKSDAELESLMHE